MTARPAPFSRRRGRYGLGVPPRRGAKGACRKSGYRLLHQLLSLSKVVASKYNCLRWGIRLLGAAIVLATGAGILDLIVG